MLAQSTSRTNKPMTRIEYNCQTRQTRVIQLTQAELDAAALAKAAEDEFNSPDNVASRQVDSTDGLWFAINFNQENRIRGLENRAQITKAQYRDALIALYKSL